MASTISPILGDSDWSERHKAISFRRLMHLKRHPSKIDIFYSTSAGYPPTPSTRTYGGHVFAQAAWAAAHTVAPGLHVHSITGYFLLQGDTRYAFEYRVKRIRDGGVYALRSVEAYQDSPAAENGKAPVFTCIISFKRDERNKHKVGAKGQRQRFQHQEMSHGWLEEEYGHVLRRKQNFEDWPVCQGMDGLWPVKADPTVDEWKQKGEAFPGLEMRKVDMTPYNKPAVKGGIPDDGDSARKWRLLTLYRIVNDHDDLLNDTTSTKQKHAADDVLNLHACAHLYASDRNSLFLAQRALGFQDSIQQMGSLSHTVNFHTDASDLLMVGDSGKCKEYVQEAWTSNSGADRVCHNSRIWDRDTGRILASTVQDGMMRVPYEISSFVIDGDTILKREAKL